MTEDQIAVFTHYRDHAKPVMADLSNNPRSTRDPRAGYDRDHDALVKCRQSEPPSKAHLKRLARHAAEIPFIEARANGMIPRHECSPVYAFTQRAKEDMARLLAAEERDNIVHHIEPASCTSSIREFSRIALTPPVSKPKPKSTLAARDPLDEQIHRLRERTIAEIMKCRDEFQPDLFF